MARASVAMAARAAAKFAAPSVRWMSPFAGVATVYPVPGAAPVLIS